MSTTVTYKGNTIATLTNQTKTLTTAGTWLDANIVVTDTSSTSALTVTDITDAAGGTIRTISAVDISDTTAIASDVASGKYFYTANGTKTLGTATGGSGGGSTPSATQHNIYFEFSDNTNTTIPVYYNDSLIGTMITSYPINTYNNKTVNLAQLDNVTWYTRPTETWETLYEDANTGYYYEENGQYPYCWISSLSDVSITAGSEWRITFEGNQYLCTAVYDTALGGLYFIGNPKYSGGTDNGSNAPFSFYNAGYGAWSGSADKPNIQDTTQNASVKIERLITA